jgi:predicted GH43/DUF377 family glycosyl hydrolase
MEKTLVAFFLSFLLLLIGCSKNNTVLTPPSNSTGGISFKFDPTTIPTGVTVISATLSRTGYTTITKNLNLISDSTADISIPAIQIGTWHLKVDAKNNDGTILYKGETDVVVQENIVVQLNLTLNPVATGMGTIYIFVTWGTSNSGKWTDYGGNPVFTRNNNPSLPGHVSCPKVLYDNGIYKMWYEAIYNGGVANIWYAESQDGISWNTIGSNPILTKGASGNWDDFSVVPSVVLKVNNQYRMYYLGCHSASGTISVGLALSTDGINWVKNNAPVIAATTEYYVVGVTDIIKKDSLYLAYLNYNNSRSANNSKLGIATSYDGISWTMYSGNPILTATLDWEAGTVSWPTVMNDNNQYRMVYSAGTQQVAFGYATSNDGFNFIKQTTQFFSTSNTVKKYIQVLYPFYRKINNEHRIYYAGQSNAGELSINLLRILN